MHRPRTSSRHKIYSAVGVVGFRRTESLWNFQRQNAMRIYTG